MKTRHSEVTDFEQMVKGIDDDLLYLNGFHFRAFLALSHARVQETAAELLDSDPSTVGRQKGSLAKRISAIAGESPFTEEHRGGQLSLTPPGVIFREHAEQILRNLFILNQQLRKPRPVRLAMTNFITEVPVVGEILKDAYARLGMSSLLITQIASDDISRFLKKHFVDFVFSGLLVRNDEPDKPDKKVGFKRFFTEPFGLLANYEIKPSSTAKELILREAPFLMPPTHGTFFKILSRILKRKEIDKLPGPRSANLPFSLDLIRLGSIPKACVLVEGSLFKILAKKSPHLHFQPFSNFEYTMQIGCFYLKESQRRKRGKPGADQPVQAFHEIVLSHIPTQRESID